MDIASWQALTQRDPIAAAGEFFRRVDELSPAQRKAIWAWLPAEAELAADLQHSRDSGGPLAGVPYALKDLFAVAGLRTRAGGKLPARRSRIDGALVAAWREAGLVMAGKTHLHEFAYGLTGTNPHYGNVVHPLAPDRTSGGSSSGSAAAVAAGIVPVAVGTDTGGSVRVPAAYCGLYGWRESPGDAWVADSFALAPRFDTAGWLTRTARDMRRVLEVFRDIPSTDSPPRGLYLSPHDLGRDCDPVMSNTLATAASRFTDHKNVEASRSLADVFDECLKTYVVLQSMEAYACHQTTLDAKRDSYGDAVWQRINRGRGWTRDQLDRARVHEMKIRLAWSHYFESWDFLVMPASCDIAPRATELDQAQRDAQLSLTAPASLGGVPVLTVPVLLADGSSLGLQIAVRSPRSPAISALLARCENCS